MTASEFFTRLGGSAKSLVKVMLQSRCTHFKTHRQDGPLIVMANGPSLNDTMRDSLDILQRHDTVSVNFAPLSEAFAVIKPRYHVLADPLFFSAEPLPNVVRLYDALKTVDWPLTIFVPRKYVSKARRLLSISKTETADNPISIQPFNFVGADGFAWLEKLLYNSKSAMPRPRNVLVPALMCGIWLGYKQIYVVGADHSWMKTISVDSDNNVISVQPHFYKDDASEQKRVDTTYRDYRLHQIVHSFYVAFRSYHTLQRYAKKIGVKIYNSTPDSFIDAFPRKSLTR